jgi:hypothetical protein
VIVVKVSNDRMRGSLFSSCKISLLFPFEVFSIFGRANTCTVAPDQSKSDSADLFLSYTCRGAT